MEEIVEDCPVCDEYTLRYVFWFPECTNCGWWPVSIPYEESDYKQAKIDYEKTRKDS